MSSSRRRFSTLLGGLLAAGLALLALMLARGFPSDPPPATPESDTPVLPAPSATAPSAGGALFPLPTIDPTLAAIDRPALQDDWAAQVVLQAIDHLNQEALVAGTPYTPLQENVLWGRFTTASDSVVIGGQAPPVGSLASIDVVLYAPDEPGGFSQVGRIEASESALRLYVFDEATGRELVRTFSGGVDATAALAALSRQASAHEVAFVAAYWENPGNAATLALVEVRSPGDSTPVAENPVEAGPEPETTPLPTPVYQTEILRTVERSLIPLIEATRSIPDSQRPAIESYRVSHARVGVLTWDDDIASPLVDNLPVLLDEPVDGRLTVFGVTSGAEPTPPFTLLQAYWDGDGTTLESEDSTEWYYGFRLNEMLHALVIAAEREGGQLTVAYDNLGNYRALTILEFQPLPVPPAY